jgi:hypothetical protein
MRIRSAIEVMKMLGPIAPEFTKETSTLKIMKAIINRIYDEHPPAALRLLSLMENKPIEEIALELSENMDARELYVRLIEGFNRNDIVLMMDFASVLGLAEARWVYGG